MSAYDEDPEVKAYIDDRMQEINESVYPILNGVDCTAKEMRDGMKRERELRREIKAKDKQFYMDTFEI